jgi:ferredoxin
MGRLNVTVMIDRCEGCGLCADVAPEAFVFDGAPPVVVSLPTIESSDADLWERVLEVQTLCPTGAVTIAEEAQVGG